MRPIATGQDALRYPLNELLGTEAHVRILRVLREVEGSLSIPKIADLAELTVVGARKAIDRLSQTGFIVRQGDGHQHRYTLRRNDWFADLLDDLFEAERRRYEDLLGKLRTAANRLSPPPISVWIEGGQSRPGDPLVLGLLHRARSLSDAKQQLRSALSSIESEFDVTIEINGYTQAEILDLELPHFTLLSGIPPIGKLAEDHPPAKARSHADLEERTLARSEALATLVRENPSLISRAQKHLDRLLQGEQGSARRALEEWRDILQTYSQSRLLRLMTSSSARALRLRQSSPFLAVLSAKELDRLLAQEKE